MQSIGGVMLNYIIKKIVIFFSYIFYVLRKFRLQINCLIIFALCLGSCYAADPSSIQISGVSDMLEDGQTLIQVAAKWGGIVTVVCAALALGRGRMEGAIAQTTAKILIVVGLLIASTKFFGPKIAGFAF
jgi:coenzyme F420-reducing hydrogenase beta subunit